jgi:NAD(P)-dependent dehydrogenase (short-subunit alcohol dehydrogenase family)
MSERVAVVTGGTGVLGTEVVASLLEEEWTVWVPWTRERSIAALMERLGQAPGLRAHRADLTDPGSVDAFFGLVGAAHPGVDLLCNLVGGFVGGAIAETDPSTWSRMWSLNATAPFLALRSAIPLLRRRGAGRIVNVAAAAAQGGGKKGMSAYLAAKAAVVSLTRNLAEELAADGITVNAVAPTIIDTPSNRQAMPESDRSGWLDPREIAAVIRFLAGQDAAVVSGNVLVLRKSPKH